MNGGFSPGRVRVLLLQEALLHLRGPLVWALLALAILASTAINPAAFVASGGPSASGAVAWVTSMHAMAQVFSLGGFLVYVFFASIMAGNAVIRDDEACISDLLHQTRLTPLEYVLGRLGGVLLALGTVLAVHTLFVALWYQVLPVPGLDGQRGPFEAQNYLVPSLAFAFPALWASAALAFAVGERTRRPMAVYAIPILLLGGVLFFLWTWSPAGIDPTLNRLLMIVDPSGLRWMRETVYGVHQGVDFYNANPIGFDGTFLLRVLFWTALPALAVAGSVGHVRRVARGRATGAKRKRSRSGASGAGGTTVPTTPARPEAGRPKFEPVRSLRMSASPPGYLRTLLVVFRAELAEMRAQPILLLAVPVVVLTVLEFATATDVAGGAVMLTAGQMAVNGVEILTVLLSLLILFSTVEALHREQTTGLAAIYFSAPFSAGAYLLAKNLATAVLVSALLLLCAILGIVQLAAQGGPVEVGPFLLVWGAILAPTFVFWSALVTLTYSLTRHRAATYGVGLLVLVGTTFLFSSGNVTWVTNWPLWGTLRWSDMGPFSLNAIPLAANRVLVLLAAVLFSELASIAFRRGDGPIRLSGRRLVAVAPTLVLAVLLAAWMTRQVGRGFQSQDAGELAYEEAAARLASTPTPLLVFVDVDTQLNPGDRTAEISGAYTMVNPGDSPIDNIPFTLGDGFTEVHWSVDEVAVEQEALPWLDVLALNRILLPGDTLSVEFGYTLSQPRGWTRNGGGVGHFILSSGVLLSTIRGDFLPVIGTRSERVDTVRSVAAEPRRVPPPFRARVRISVPEGYTATSVGRRVSAEVTGGHSITVFETDHPVRAINVMAGRWEVAEADGSAVYYHPGHEENVAEIVGALGAARTHYGALFGPYPWEELRLNEFPALETNATSFPTNISFSEGIGFLSRPSADSRLAFSVTAHEVAHQWWGNLIAVDNAPGSGVLVEGMANYATMVLHEAVNGDRARIGYATWLENGYVTGRRPDAEVALLDNRETTGREEAATSVRGAWALWMLRQHLGAAEMDGRLRSFALRYRDAINSPSLTGLLRSLSPAGAADSTDYAQQVALLFGNTGLPEFRIEDHQSEQVESGWMVSALVKNAGSQRARVEVSVFAGVRWEEDYREVRQTVNLLPGQEARVSWTAPFEPEGILVDPDAHVLQVNRDRASVTF